MHIAKNKGLAIANQNKFNRTILAADTIVICDNKIIGKPSDREEAIKFLELLSANTHKVITGIFILKNGEEIIFEDKTSVSCHPLTKEQIINYLDKYQPYDKY